MREGSSCSPDEEQWDQGEDEAQVQGNDEIPT
jgi:hypothetical protein